MRSDNITLLAQEAGLETAYPVDHPMAKFITAIQARAASKAQREWIGLTNDERNLIGRSHAYVDDIIKATEAKLKEKNNA